MNGGKNQTDTIPALLGRVVGLQDIPALLRRMKLQLDAAETSEKVIEVRDAAKAVLHYAKLRKATDETKADCLRVMMFAEVRMVNEIDAAQERGDVAKPGGDRDSIAQTAGNRTEATYADLGVSSQRLSEWRKVRDAGGENAIDAAISDLLAKGREPTHANVERAVKGLYFSTKYSGDYEWYTPAQYVDAARAVLGTIDLDPASSDAAQEVVRAERFFTVDDDGLGQEWHGKVWLNPPYSMPEILRFVEKLVAEVDAGRTTEAILLIHNHTDTGWFDVAWHAADAFCLTHGRVRFVNANGDTGAPTQGHVFVYFGDNVALFHEVFEDQFGNVGVPYGKRGR